MRRYLSLLFAYRGREGTWAWLFHRISGVGIWLFVVLHVVDIYLVGGNPKAYDDLLTFYASPAGRVLETVLGAALLYHALNGLRIIIIDLWPAMTVHHRALWWASWVIFVAVGVPGAVIILRPLWKGAFGIVLGHPLLGLT
jgi:succinate dehydrogenase / fumarate reductase cytochrome b subunit